MDGIVSQWEAINLTISHKPDDTKSLFENPLEGASIQGKNPVSE
jgi:hypothetical protein